MQTENGAGTARARRRANVAMRIEMATLAQCLARGVDAVTVEEVAAAAGISRRTFYRYFDTIDDVLCAMPRRSLNRVSTAYSSRPLSESVIEAFIQVYRNTRISDEEHAIHRLAVDVAQRSSEAWWRAMNRMQPSANEFYQQLIAERLRAQGKDPAPAGLIAAVITAVIGYVAQESIGKGQYMPQPSQLETALISLAGIMKDALQA